MPNCFQLYPKGSSEPAKLAEVDDAICAHLGIEPDPVKYAYGWFDSLGFRRALGWSHEKIVADLETLQKTNLGEYYSTLLVIENFLHENYSTQAWAEIGRR